MTATQKQSEMVSTASHQLEEVISNSMKKIGIKSENALCRYLPMSSGGYMHHFTLRKMKHQAPQQLSEMLKTFIINSPKPTTVPPKQRAARGSRKKKDQIVLTKSDIDRILHMARAIGDKDVIRKLMPRKEMKQLKRELISSIRNGRVEQELWLQYAETISQLPV
ncbi:MAG: hypothetical protein JWO53_340 [Chlamydiia bacterium]|nr:hypothetical protein [Chlamydiia bacterium]